MILVKNVCKTPWISVDEINIDGTKYYVVPSKGGVMCIVYDVDLEKYIMVNQARVPVIYNNLKESSQNIWVGVMTEFCAGTIEDSDTDIRVRMSDEILEELGYNVDPSDLEYLERDFTCVGISGAPMHIFRVNVNQSQKVLEGGGEENENIKVIERTAEELIESAFDNNSYMFSPLTKYLILKYIKGTAQ